MNHELGISQLFAAEPWPRNLTRKLVQVLETRDFVLSTRISNQLIPSSEKSHAGEGEEERGCRGDMPPAEYDAEIGSVPGKQHLSLVKWLSSAAGAERGAERTFMLHMGSEGISMCCIWA